MDAVVYWIHKRGHTNPDEEGYVGVTTNLSRRMAGHRRSGINPIMTNVVRKYGWDELNVVILHRFSETLCYQLEAEYRPTAHIGWNCKAGGHTSNAGESNPAYGRVGKAHPMSQPWCVEGIHYESLTDAAAFYGITRQGLRYQLKNGLIEGHKLTDEV